MLVTLITWLYILPLLYIYGWLGLSVLRKILKPVDRPDPFPFFIVILVGLASVAALTNTLFVFIKIGLLAHLIILGGAFVASLVTFEGIQADFSARWQTLKISSKNQAGGQFWCGLDLLIVISLTLLLAFRAAIDLFNFDTGLYHLQAVEWASRYAAVPGLGNFHDRLAVHSSWFSLGALFNFSFLAKRLGQQPLYSLNCLLLLLIILFSYFGVRKVIDRDITLPSIFQSLLWIPLITWCFNFAVAGSPSTDLPAGVVILSAIAVGLKLTQKKYQQLETELDLAIVSLLCSFAVTIKLSTFPLLLLPIYLWGRQISSAKKLEKSTVLAVFLPIGFILIPHCTVITILSGYILFPFPYIDVFNFDWKIPYEAVVLNKNIVNAWAKVPSVDTQKVIEMSFSEWFPRWLKVFEKTREYAFLKVITIIFAAYSCFRGNFVKKILSQYGLIFVVILMGISFWFALAPDPRFAYGFLWGLIILLIATIVLDILQNLANYQRVARISVTILFGAILILNTTQLYQEIKLLIQSAPTRAFLVYPVPYPTPVVRSLSLQGIEFFTLTGSYQCWAVFPCAPYLDTPIPVATDIYPEGLVHAGLQLRGAALSRGFRRRSSSSVN